MPLIRLAEAFGHPSTADSELLQVIVYADNGRSVGLVVNEILDIVDQKVAVQHVRDAGALQGTAVIHQHVTDLLDVPALLAEQQLSSRGAVA
jgi:two-component system chemotaxis sensor kinase CheA